MIEQCNEPARLLTEINNSDYRDYCESQHLRLFDSLTDRVTVLTDTLVLAGQVAVAHKAQLDKQQAEINELQGQVQDLQVLMGLKMGVIQMPKTVH